MAEPEPPDNELFRLAKEIAAIDDEDVIDSAASIAAWYRRESFVALGLAAVDAMAQGGTEEIDESDPRLEAVRLRLRDWLRGLLDWAKETGRS
jgi:hypothetical protein